MQHHRGVLLFGLLDSGKSTLAGRHEISSTAGVPRLVPFHLPRRCAHDLADMFDEVRAAGPRALLPPA